jgi:hypothetical protein
MAESPDLAEARRQADEARTKLLASFDDLIAYRRRLQDKLKPGHLARDAWGAARDKSVDLAEDAVDAVRKRPVAATGAVAALALFIAREPLMDLAGNLMSGAKKKKKVKKAAKPRDQVEEVDE